MSTRSRSSTRPWQTSVIKASACLKPAPQSTRSNICDRQPALICLNFISLNYLTASKYGCRFLPSSKKRPIPFHQAACQSSAHSLGDRQSSACTMIAGSSAAMRQQWLSRTALAYTKAIKMSLPIIEWWLVRMSMRDMPRSCRKPHLNDFSILNVMPSCTSSAGSKLNCCSQIALMTNCRVLGQQYLSMNCRRSKSSLRL